MINRDDRRILRLAESLDNQTSDNFIWLIYDNSKEPGYLTIIDEIRSKYPKLNIELYKESNIAEFGTMRGRSFDQVTTEFTLLIDADDYISENYIESMEKIVYKKDPNIIYLQNYQIFYGDGKLVNCKIKKFKDAFKAYYSENYSVFFWGNLIRTSVLKKYTRDFLPLHIYEDYIMFYNLSRYEKE